MAVPVQTPAKVSTANGLTTVFPYDFLILDEADLLVTGTLDGTTTTYALNVDYTVDGVGVAAGGNVTFVSAPADGTSVLRRRNMAAKREEDYQANGDLIASEVNADYDRAVMLIQQLEEEQGRAIKLPAHLTGQDGTLPSPEALRPLVWNTAGTGIENGDTELTGDLLLRPNLEDGTDGLFTQAGTGAVARGFRAKLRERVSVEDFGAAGDATTDDTAAFQAAVAALPANGGTIYLHPDGRYKLTSMVLYDKPVLWKCERGHSDVSTNTNGGDAERPVVFWGGAGAVEALLKQAPPAVGTALWGGGAEGITFDGFNLAEYGIHLDNARYATLSGKARNCTVAGALLSSLSGTVGVFSKKCHVKDWEYVYGTEVAAANSHGLRIIGNGSTVPATQHKIDRIFALVKHGAALCVEETDNCQIHSAQAVGDSGSGGGGGAATGCTVLFRNVGSTVAYNNHITYLAGELRQENGCFGNTVEHLTSEGGGIAQVSGTSVWHGTITNYTSGSERYRSREYPLRDVISIAPGAMLGLSASFWLSKWSGGSLPDGASNTATAIIPVPCWQDGVIESVSVLLGTAAAAAGNYRMVLDLSASAPNTAGLATPERTVTETVAGPSQNQYKEHVFTMAELAFTKGDTLFVSVTRLGADAADTSTTEAVLLGIRVKYRATGPAGTTALYLPTWGMP